MMLRPPVHDVDWAVRVLEAGVCLDLFDRADDDNAFALLGVTILRAVSDSALSDEDAYPLLVRFWNGDWPRIDWPAHAPAVARRCAAALAERGTCELESLLYAPTNESLRLARDAIIADLGLTAAELLAALAEHWDEVAALEMPTDGSCSLLAFARHVLLEPLVGACAMIWSTLNAEAMSATAGSQITISWQEWSPVAIDDWVAVVAAELVRLGRPADPVPDGDLAADLLASARAAVLGSHDGAARVAASIVRTSCWPGPIDIIDPIASAAIAGALVHVDELDPATDNDGLVDLVQGQVLPPDEDLTGWVRDTSFGTLYDHACSARTGADMLQTAADWLTWSIARAALEAAAATRRPPSSTG